MKVCFLYIWLKERESFFLVEEQVPNYSDIGANFLLDECCFALFLRFLPK